MGARGGWRGRGGWANWREGLAERDRSARLACSLKGLAGLSWRTVPDLDLGLEGEAEGEWGNLGVSRGLLGTLLLL